MANLIHHIGLQVIEKDILSFYMNVLGSSAIREFTLLKDDAFPIFSIPNEVKIVYTQCGNIELKLFIDKKPNVATFNHVCIHADNVAEIVKKAPKAGFGVFIREKADHTTTYFVSDSNHNLFEMKIK
jgi:hypothetical protein